MLTKPRFYFQAQKDQGQGPGDPDEGDQDPKDFETWIESQDEKIKELYQQNVAGLKTALTKTRDEKDNALKQLKDAASKKTQVQDKKPDLKIEDSSEDVIAKLMEKLDQLDSKITTTETERAAQTKRNHLKQLAEDAGMSDPTDVLRFVSLDAEEPEKEITTLLETKPYLKKRPPSAPVINAGGKQGETFEERKKRLGI